MQSGIGQALGGTNSDMQPHALPWRRLSPDSSQAIAGLASPGDGPAGEGLNTRGWRRRGCRDGVVLAAARGDQLLAGTSCPWGPAARGDQLPTGTSSSLPDPLIKQRPAGDASRPAGVPPLRGGLTEAGLCRDGSLPENPESSTEGSIARPFAACRGPRPALPCPARRPRARARPVQWRGSCCGERGSAVTPDAPWPPNRTPSKCTQARAPTRAASGWAFGVQ